jgi:hypothetical protein
MNYNPIQQSNLLWHIPEIQGRAMMTQGLQSLLLLYQFTNKNNALINDHIQHLSS